MFDNLFLFLGPIGTAGALFAVLAGVFSLIAFPRCPAIDRRGHAR